jgi:two-component sensor histidine kinase
MSDPQDALGFLNGGGEIASLIRARDWSGTQLGAPSGWPHTLKAALATCLNTRFPMVVWWGPDLLMLYNDAWQPILGSTKHPGGLGQPGATFWPETWPVVGKQFERALAGEANWAEDLLLASDRQGFLEECYFTYSHSPLKDHEGCVVGVLSTVLETTNRVLSLRRMTALSALSNATLAATRARGSVEETCQTLTGLLCKGHPDVPFAVTYLASGEQALTRAASACIDGSHFPNVISIRDHDAWGVAEAFRSGAAATAGIENRLDGFRDAAWGEPVLEAITLPLADQANPEMTAGVLIAGINPRLRLDPTYLEFLKLAAAQAAGAISTVEAAGRERRALEVKQLLIHELQHRTRNLMAVIRAISSSTRRASSTLEDYAEAFEGRLDAMARTQAFLSPGKGEGVTLRTLIDSEIEAFGAAHSGVIAIEGPDIHLPDHSLLVLSLALHELATNAVKHGALKHPDGTLNVTWTLTKEGMAVLLRWCETLAHPAPASPVRQGFGRTLIERSLPSQLKAETSYNLTPDGLVCEIEIPLENADAQA